MVSENECPFRLSGTRCSAEDYVCTNGKICDAHGIEFFNVRGEMKLLPPHYRSDDDNGMFPNRGITLIAFNPSISTNSNEVVFEEGDRIFPTSEECMKYLAVHKNEPYQAALERLPMDKRTHLEKLRRKHAFLKQLAICFARDKKTTDLNALSPQHAVELFNEAKILEDTAYGIIGCKIDGLEGFPPLEFRLSKPLERYFRSLTMFDGKYQVIEKPWNLSQSPDVPYFAKEATIQYEILEKFKTFLCLYMVSDKFPETKPKDYVSQYENIISDVVSRCGAAHSFLQTSEDELRKYLRRVMVNQYCNKAFEYYPLIVDAVSASVLSITMQLGIPVSEEPVVDNAYFEVDSRNNFFHVETFQGIVTSAKLIQNAEIIMQTLNRIWFDIPPITRTKLSLPGPKRRKLTNDNANQEDSGYTIDYVPA